MVSVCPLVRFVKPKSTRPEISLLSFDGPSTVPQMSLRKSIGCMDTCVKHSQQDAPGQPRTSLLTNAPLAPASLPVSYYS